MVSALSQTGNFGLELVPNKWYHPLVGLTGMTQHKRDEPETESFWGRVRMASSRGLACTTNGYLALVPMDSRPGDKIALCRGSKLPLVLTRWAWDLVSCIHVHGIMHGEAWDPDRCDTLMIS